MKTLSELKSAALQSLKGKWALCVFATLVYFLCCIPYSYINFKIQFQNFSEPSFNSMNLLLLMYAYLFIIMMPLAYGYSVSFLKLVREDDDYMISQMFRNFANYKRAFLVPLIVFIYTVL